MMVETYRHSGRIGPMGIPLMVVGGGVTAVVLGAIYAYALAWIPIIYANLLLTAGLGAGIGFVVGLAAKAGKVRNQMVISLFGLLAGMIGLATAWSFDATAKFPETFEGPLTEYEAIRTWMEFCYEKGTWGMSENAPVSGMFLAAIWIAEALAVLGLAFFVAGMITDSTPFCEQCMKWTNVQEGLATLHPPEEDNSAIDNLCNGDVSAINSFTRAAATAGAYLRLDTAQCEDCDQCNCVSLALAEVSVDKNGDNQINTTMLATHMLLSGEAMESLKQNLDQLQGPVTVKANPSDEEEDDVS